MFTVTNGQLARELLWNYHTQMNPIQWVQTQYTETRRNPMTRNPKRAKTIGMQIGREGNARPQGVLLNYSI